MASPVKNKSRLKEALLQQLPDLRTVLLFSLLVNILVLAPTLYMLEVYDRVVNSRNHTTLLMLTLLVVGLYVLLEVFEWVRSRLMNEVGVAVERNLRESVLHAIFTSRLLNARVSGLQVLNDLKVIRDTLPSGTVLAVFDAPLALLILILLFVIHPMMGWFAVAGAVVQGGIGLLNQRRMRKPFLAASGYASMARNYADDAVRNAQVIEAMGMLPGIHGKWRDIQQGFLRDQAVASDMAGSSSAVSKMMQSLTGSLLLGIGALLALDGVIGGSLIIVGSILGGRVLTPLVRIVGGWRQIEAMRESMLRLDGLMAEYPLPEEAMELPPPKGQLTVEQVSAVAPEVNRMILGGVSFQVASGGSVAVVGPSGAGKTTLARLLVGIWPPVQGKVRLDSVDVYSWNKDELGSHIGYLPQDVELFEGTLAENIGRFGEVDREKVEKACRSVGLDDFVAALPQGYDTQVGADGAFLSGGQRQRVGLARAIYGSPAFVVLDEPNSSLDEAGDAALMNVLGMLREQGTTVIVITQRKQILSALDYLLVLLDGKVHRFGRRDEVMAELQLRPAVPSAGNGKTTGGER